MNENPQASFARAAAEARRALAKMAAEARELDRLAVLSNDALCASRAALMDAERTLRTSFASCAGHADPAPDAVHLDGSGSRLAADTNRRYSVGVAGNSSRCSTQAGAERLQIRLAGRS